MNLEWNSKMLTAFYDFKKFILYVICNFYLLYSN